MQGQNLWISVLVTIQIASALCQTSSYENTTEEQYAGDTYDEYVSTGISDGLSAGIGVVSFTIFVALVWCICYRCVCRRQTNYGGLILSNPTPQVNVVQVVQHSPQQGGQSGQSFPQQNQPMKQPECPPTQHFPPQYQPVQQFAPHGHPMQQFPPQHPPMQQFPPQNQPMQQFAPQHSPMQQFPPQNQPMQQFSPQDSPKQQFPPQDQTMQQFSPQHPSMHQFQQSAAPPQNQFSSPENFVNFPELPPPYENDLPLKY